MGWIYMDQPHHGWKAELDAGLTWENETATNRVLDSAIVHRREYYAAVETIRKDTGEREVWAAVYMLDFRPNDRFPFGFKDMSEFCGPTISQCPERILDLLTPLEGNEKSVQWAKEWRKRCRENIRHRKKISALKVGDTFTYKDAPYVLEKKRPFIARKQGGGSYRFHASAKRSIQTGVETIRKDTRNRER